MAEAEETKVLYECEDFLALYKEKGLPTVPLKNNPEGDSLLSRISRIYPEVMNISSSHPWEGGIIHRLDTPTSGIVIAARNQKAYDELMRKQKSDGIEKHYKAEVTAGGALLPGFERFPYSWCGNRLSISSYFRTYGERGASVRPVLNNKRNISGELYRTEVYKTNVDNVFECVITRGFRHQIRSHLSWAGYPIIGDSRYGGEENDYLLLEAFFVVFTYKGKIIEIEIP